MAKKITYFSNRVIDTDGIADGALLYVYESGTTNLVSIFADEAATVPLTNPHPVSAGAAVPPIYFTYTGEIRVRVMSSDGAVIQDEDPYKVLVSFGDFNSGNVAAENQGTLKEQLAGTLNAAQFGVVVDDGTIDNADALERWRDELVRTGAHGTLPFGRGTIYSSRAIEFPHTGSYYRMDTGLRITGSPMLKLTRKDIAPSNFVNTAKAGTVVTPGAGITSSEGGFYINNTAANITLTGAGGATIAANGLTEASREAAAESFFAFYGSNYIPESLFFEDCRRGLYIGQDPDQVGIEASSNTRLFIGPLWMKNCSVGYTSRASSGSHYNDVSGVHAFQCQIGFDIGQMDVSIGVTHNNNRNTYTNNRAARCQVGFWFRMGDTNNVFACHTENCQAAPTNNRYASPAGLPDGRTSWAFINTGTKGKFTGCVDEASPNVIYSTDAEGEYLNCSFRVEDGTSASLFTVPPRLYLSQQVTYTNGGAFSLLPNINSSVFGNRVANPFFSEPLRVEGEITQTLNHGLGTTTNKVGTIRQLVDVGAVSSGGTYALPLWQSVTFGESRRTETAAFFDVTVIGDCVANNLAHLTTFRVLARRSSSGTLVRYYLIGAPTGGRATGANAGDTGEVFGVALSDVDGVLTATLTAPARDFAEVMIITEAAYARP